MPQLVSRPLQSTHQINDEHSTLTKNAIRRDATRRTANPAIPRFLRCAALHLNGRCIGEHPSSSSLCLLRPPLQSSPNDDDDLIPRHLAAKFEEAHRSLNTRHLLRLIPMYSTYILMLVIRDDDSLPPAYPTHITRTQAVPLLLDRHKLTAPKEEEDKQQKATISS